MMKYKLTELKREIDNSTITAGDSNILLSITDIRPKGKQHNNRPKGKRNCEQQYKPKRPNRFTEPSIQQKQVHILLQCTSVSGTSNKSQQFFK